MYPTITYRSLNRFVLSPARLCFASQLIFARLRLAIFTFLSIAKFIVIFLSTINNSYTFHFFQPRIKNFIQNYIQTTTSKYIQGFQANWITNGWTFWLEFWFWFSFQKLQHEIHYKTISSSTSMNFQATTKCKNQKKGLEQIFSMATYSETITETITSKS